MPPSNMDGIRNFRFAISGDTLELTGTDFWIGYAAVAQGTEQPELSLTLNNIWQHSDFADAKGLARRDFIEERVKELTWDFVGKKGNLFVDESTPQAKTINDITLTEVTLETVEFNELIEFSLTFTFPLSAASGIGGVEIARELSFLRWPHNFILRSEELDNGNWGQIGTISIVVDDPGLLAPDKTQTAETVSDTDGATLSNIVQSRQVKFGGDSELYEGSIHLPVLTTQLTFPGIEFELTGGIQKKTSYTVDQIAGTLTLQSGEPAAQLAKIVRVSATWWRVALRIQNNGGNDSGVFRVYPSVNTDGSSSWIATTTGAVGLWGGQISRTLAARDAPVPYISTTSLEKFTTPLAPSLENYIVERTKEDLGEFKRVFRAAPIRVFGGSFLETIRIIGIKENTASPQSTLAQRQESEGIVKAWVDLVGFDGILRIDNGVSGEELLVAHLQEARPDDLSLPDAVTYALQFATGYGE